MRSSSIASGLPRMTLPSEARSRPIHAFSSLSWANSRNRSPAAALRQGRRGFDPQRSLARAVPTSEISALRTSSVVTTGASKPIRPAFGPAGVFAASSKP